MTANNAELYAWPIDLEQSRITLSAGEPVTVNIADYKITDPKLVLRSPLDSQLPTVAPSPAPLVLTGIYETVLRSFRSPGLSGHLNPANDGHFIFTAEFLLRGGIKCCYRNSAMKTLGGPSFGEPSMRLASVGML